MFLLKRIPLQNMSFLRQRTFMTVQVYYKTYNSMSNDYNIIHLNGTSGGYQSDKISRT